MIDIVSSENGLDLGIFNTQVEKAGNVLKTQLGRLEYLPDFGIDLRYFLSEDFVFENESFKAYCVETLANNGINVTEVLEETENLFSVFDFKLTPQETSTALVSR